MALIFHLKLTCLAPPSTGLLLYKSVPSWVEFLGQGSTDSMFLHKNLVPECKCFDLVFIDFICNVPNIFALKPFFNVKNNQNFSVQKYSFQNIPSGKYLTYFDKTLIFKTLVIWTVSTSLFSFFTLICGPMRFRELFEFWPNSNWIAPRS